MLRSLRFLSLALLAAWLPAAPPTKAPALRAYFAPKASELQEGGVRLIPIHTPKGTFKVWTKRFGHNPRIKLLLLHGGPGATHEYFEALETWLGAEGIEFIYYDQLGSAYSDQPTDTSLWTIDRFVDEVEQVRQALGLTKDDFYLLGHSWGGVLAIEYALRYQHHLKGVIISNMMSNIAAYNQYAETVLGPQMDPAVLKEIKALEAKGQYESPRYMELLTPAFYHEHVCRLAEWPDAVNRAFGRMNRQVYVLMQGTQRIRRLRPPGGMGPEGRPAEADHAHPRHRRRPRHHGSRPHEVDGRPGAARQLPPLPEGQPHGHVGRPGHLRPGPHQVPGGRGPGQGEGHVLRGSSQKG